MTPTPFDGDDRTRPIWLTTLADLGLLLVGFFVFVQAATHLDPVELTDGIKRGFGVRTERAAEPARIDAHEAAMAQDLTSVDGFAPGSAVIADDLPGIVRWVRAAAADPRTRLRIAAGTDGSARDVDAATGSAAILAADRARAVAAALVRAGAIAPDRIEFAGAEQAPAGRLAMLQIGFAGEAPRAEPRP